MLILDLLDPSTQNAADTELTTLLDSHGISTRHITPSSMSFLTSMRIATECKTCTPDAVVVHRLKDAIGAISARDLTRKRNLTFRIVYTVSPAQPVPRRVPTAVMNGVDVWVFPADELLAQYRAIEDMRMREATILYPTAAGMIPEYKAADNGVRTLTWFGPLDNPEPLAAVVSAMSEASAPYPLQLRVLSTGRARDVMPIVRRARAEKLAVEWLGDNYDIDRELAGADAAIAVDSYPTSLELRIMASGRPVVNATQISELTDPDRYPALCKEALTMWDKRHRPEIYIEHLKSIIRP